MVAKMFMALFSGKRSVPPGPKLGWWRPLQHWWLPLVVALGVRLLAAFVWEWYSGGKLVFGDSESYWVLARALARGEEYRYGNARIFRMPGYPAVLAPLFWLTPGEPPYLWGRIEGALLGTMAVWGIYLLGKHLANARVGIISAWWAAIYPGGIALSVWILSEALFCPLMIFALLLTVIAFRKERREEAFLWAAAAGLGHGLSILTRPSWLFFPLFVGLVAVFTEPNRLRQATVAALIILTTACTLSPWWLRNWCLTGRWIPTTLQVGTSLYDGLHPKATGASDLSYVSAKMAEWAKEYNAISPAGLEHSGGRMGHGENFHLEKRKLAPQGWGEVGKVGVRTTDIGGGICRGWLIWQISEDARRELRQEMDFDARLREEALRWAWANPGQAAFLALVKLRRLWNIWPNERAFQLVSIRLMIAASFLPTLVFGLLGMVVAGKKARFWLLGLPALYLTAIHCVFVASLRYREPAMLALVPAGALGLAYLTRKIKSAIQKRADAKDPVA